MSEPADHRSPTSHRPEAPASRVTRCGSHAGRTSGAAARLRAPAGRPGAPPPGPESDLDPSERTVPTTAAPRRSSPRCCSLAAVFALRLHRRVRRSRARHAAARALDRARARVPRRRRDRRREARRPAGDQRRGARVAARRGGGRGGRRDDRGRRRGHLPPSAADRRRRGRRRGHGHRRCHAPRRRSVRTSTASTTRRGDAACGWSTTRRARISAGRDRDRQLLHGAARARRPRAPRRRAARRQAARRSDPPAAGAPGLGARGDRRVLEDLPARRLRDLAVPLPDLPADERGPGVHLPVPLLDVLARRGRAAAVRSGRPLAAAAAADDRRRTATCARPDSFHEDIGPSWWNVHRSES